MAVSVENQGREFVRAVIPSLKKGLDSLNDFTILLLDSGKDFVGKSDPSFDKIRKAILRTKENLADAETAAAMKLEVVNKTCEELFNRKAYLTRQEEETKSLMSSLKSQQKNNNANLEMYKESVAQARRDLKDAEDYLWRQKRAIKEAEDRRNAGIGITFIPIIGWIAGPLLIKGADYDISNANKKVEETRKQVTTLESSVSQYSWKVADYSTKIQETSKNIVQVQDQLRDISLEIDQVLIKKKDFVGFQEKIRNSVKVLGGLSGTSNVAEIHTCSFVLLEGMITSMQTFVKLAEGVREVQLLQDDGINALITNLQVNYVKMQAIAESSAGGAIDGYL